MKVEKKNLDKGQVELTIEVSQVELTPYLEQAASRLSAKNPLPGFRPGKAPFEMIKSKFGEMAILQEALEPMLNQTFFKAINDEKLETVGQPNINIEKMAPGNPVVYKAVVALLPSVQLQNWDKLSVSKKTVEATEEDLQKTLQQLQNMNVKEAVAERPVKKDDKAEIDFEISINNAVIEGGKAFKYPVVIGAGNMIPGFEDNLIGLKAGEEKTFDITFPEKYFQQSIAGRQAQAKVKVINVYERKLPDIEKELPKLIGFEDIAKLKDQLKENIKQDKQMREDQRLENEVVRAIIKEAKIGELPESLVDNELHRMYHELEHNVQGQGMDMAGYLKSINKSRDDLSKDFRPQAIERVQSALILRQIALDHGIKTDEEELEKELQTQQDMYKDNPSVLKNIQHPQHRHVVRNGLTNQKVLKFIKDKIVK